MSTPERLLWYADAAPVEMKYPTGVAQRENVQCGDRCLVEVLVEGGEVRAVRAEVEGCAVCRGVAGWLQDSVPGQTIAAVLAWSPLHAVTSWGLTFGPLRRKCAALPVETLLDALHASLAAHQRDRSP